MDVCLSFNGISLDYDAAEIGALIVKAAQGIVDESELAAWLRSRAG
jgi:prophage maintenance system killer protein